MGSTGVARGGERMTVRMDPDLRALFRAARDAPGPAPAGRGRGPDPLPEPDPEPAATAGPVPDPGPSRGPGTDPGPACAPVRLRCDGRRPLCFRGTPIASERRQSALAGLGQELDLWLVEGGAVAVRVAFLGPEETPVRSQHHAAIVDSAEAMAAFLAGIDPAASLPGPLPWVPEASGLPPPGDIPDLVRRLRAGFRSLTQSLCAAVPEACDPAAPVHPAPDPALT